MIKQEGVDLSKPRISDGCAPIHIACQSGHYECIEILLNSGVDVNLMGDETVDFSLAKFCAKNGHVKCLMLLWEKGADLNKVNKLGITPAHVACQTGQPKCLQFLIAKGADINVEDVWNATPLDYARRFLQPECAAILVAAGAVGMRVEDLLEVPDSLKVRKSIMLLHKLCP
jgi:ankyrin repeat protein